MREEEPWASLRAASGEGKFLLELTPGGHRMQKMTTTQDESLWDIVWDATDHWPEEG